VTVRNGSVAFDFGGALPSLKESSAYEVVLTPASGGSRATAVPNLWEASYEAEAARYTGSGYSRNGPEGSPSDVSKFYTSGGYNVGGLRTGSDGVLDFTVDVPKAGRYDLGVFANSLNTDSKVGEQGPTNVFVRVDGGAEQELFLPLGYKWVVWDHADTTVELTAGRHVISLAARSLDGSKTTKGDAIVDRVTLALPNPLAAKVTYEAELAELARARPVYEAAQARCRVSGSGAVDIAKNGTATFWVYSPTDSESTIEVHTGGGGLAELAVNGRQVLTVVSSSSKVAVSLSGGVNKVTVTGKSRSTLLDRIEVEQTSGALAGKVYEAEAAKLMGTAKASPFTLAGGGSAVEGVGGAPGNTNTLTFRVTAGETGLHAMRVRYANRERSVATHYNPDPLAQHADISVNGAAAQRVLFPHTFHGNNFWEITVPVQLTKGTNTISFRSAELPDFDGKTYASGTYPDVLLRSRYAPIVDRISIARFSSSRLR